MDLTMSIAAMSVDLSSMRTNEQMGLSVMKMAMNAETEAVENMLEAIDVSSMTGVGANLDIFV